MNDNINDKLEEIRMVINDQENDARFVTDKVIEYLETSDITFGPEDLTKDTSSKSKAKSQK